jgi:hypothetical protein
VSTHCLEASQAMFKPVDTCRRTWQRQ